MSTHLELPLGTREWVPVSISSADDLTALTVELAFPTEGDAPTTWHTAEWVAGETNVARILVVEPGATIAGSVELDVGYHDVWARITEADQRTLIPAGRLEVYEPGAATFDRWAMTIGDAAALTGVDGISARDLERAEDELREIIGHAPRPSDYSTLTDVAGELVDRRVWALGRAIAWQAAYRSSAAATADDQAVRISDETVGDLSVGYAGSGSGDAGGTIAPRARRLLATNGWLARTSSGTTRP